MKQFYRVSMIVILLLASCLGMGCANIVSNQTSIPGETSVATSDDADTTDDIVQAQDGSDTKQGEQEQILAEYDEIISLSGMGDYVSIYPRDLYRDADLVVRATFVKNLHTYAGKAPMPITVAECTVNEVIKGDYTDGEIEIHYYGGTVPLSEWRLRYNAEGQAKYGYDKYTEEQAKKVGVSCVKTKESVDLKVGQEYLVFLARDPNEKGRYVVQSNAYGTLPINGDSVSDCDSGKMIAIKELG